MDSESSISGVPSKFHGLKILLVDNDTTSLSNIATTLEQHSFRVTTIELATLALAILQERIDEFDLVMVDVNIQEMDCFEFMRSTQLIKDIPFILMSSIMKREMVEKAREQGAYFILLKPISTKKLKNVWQYVYRHQIEASQKQKHKANDTVEVMDNKSCADKKIHDRKGKSIVTPSENYQEVGSLLEKDNAEGLKRMKIVDEESRELGKEDHSLVSKNTTEGRGKKRQCMKWTPDLEKNLKEVVHNSGEKARPRHILELMNEPNWTKSQVTNHIQLYSGQKRQVQPAIISSIDNQSKIMSQTAPPLVLGNHSSALNSNKLPMNFSEPVQEAVPLNDIFTGLNGCNQDPELGHFNVLNSDEFPMNEPVQEAVPPNDFFTGLSGCNQDPELDYFNILNSNEFPMSFNEEFQEVYLPQPPAVPSLVPPNDFFAGSDGLIQNLELEYFNLRNPNEFLMNFNEPVQEAYLPQPPAVPSLAPSNDFFGGLNDCKEDLELDPLNVLNLDKFPVNFNEELQEAYLLQPPALPSSVPPNDHFAGLNVKIMTENQISTSNNSTQDNISTRNQNP